MILNEITLLNKTTLDCISETNETNIVKSFTQLGLKILGADFGFAWFNSPSSDEWKLVYKTPNLPYTPELPRKSGTNMKVLKSSIPNFIVKIKKTNDKYDVSPYMKSYAMIPITYSGKTYGTIILCFKKQQNFSEEKRVLCISLGNNLAQSITIHRSHLKSAQLKEAKILLEQEKLKTEFIANATHELRTPLAIMKGNVDLALLEDGKVESLKEALNAVEVEVNILSKILNDLSILTLSENNNTNILTFKKVNLSQLLKQASRRLYPVASKRNIKITVWLQEDYFVNGDGRYLEKLFLNLIKNAITYGKDGGKITVIAKKNNNFIKISVTDDGPGISKEDLPKIFDRFYRGQEKVNTDGHHSGLGLAIVKWVTEAHNGKVSVKSTLNKGSVFTVTLPALKD